METFQQAQDRINKNLREKLAQTPRLTPEEYESAKRRQFAQTYSGICRPDCPTCGGTGFVKVNPDAGIHDPDFGRTRFCPNVDLAKVHGVGLGLDEQEIRLLNWDMVRDLSNAYQARDAVQEALNRGYGWVILWGNYGLAKSLILRIAIAESLRAGQMAAFVEMAGLLDDLRQAFDADCANAESARRLEKWSEIPILAVDEVDRINSTPWAKEREFQIFNFRYQQAIREKSVTLFASNRSPRQIGGALGDRMLDGRFKVVKLEGSSNRPLIDDQDF